MKGDQVFFTVALANNDHHLWKSDGRTTVGLLLAKSTNARRRMIEDVVAVGSRRVFFTVLGELWETGGAFAGTKLLVEGCYCA